MPEQPNPTIAALFPEYAEALQAMRIQRMEGMLERLNTMPPGEPPGNFRLASPLVTNSIAEMIIRQIATGYPDAPETKRQNKARKRAEYAEMFGRGLDAAAEKVTDPDEPRTVEGWGQIWGSRPQPESGSTPGGGGFF